MSYPSVSRITVGAPVRVIQCLTLLSPGLQVSILSLEEGHFCLH